MGTVGRGLCGAVWGGVGWGEQVEERGRLVREMAGDSVVEQPAAADYSGPAQAPVDLTREATTGSTLRV